MSRLLSIALVLASQGCATARIVGPQPVAPGEVLAPPVTVVLEPFFENATLEQVTERAATHTMNQPVLRKPIFAQLSALAAEHRMVLEEVQRLRPQWQVVSTGQAAPLSGPVHLVRVIVGDSIVAGSDRTLKTIATAFGVVIWPLLLVNVTPVHETQRVHGTLSLYHMDAAAIRGRLLRYPTQHDYAVDTRGVTPRHQPFALDISYEEGLFANPEKRPPVLLHGFSERLAVAVVALVEGIR